jgi:N6-L-threonylcarbamoyladenine synthase
MHILGIETSCDETATAIVDEKRHILSQHLLSQTKEHAPYGGVVPEIASRAHLAHLEGLASATLDDAGLGLQEIDAIAVTAGPGLIGGVIVGVMFAKALASSLHKPLIAVNHLEGHALTVRLTDDVAFPYLLLLASGGHCQFLLVEGVGQYHWLGGTIDDAMGEAFDKVAKMLGLGFPGGVAVEAAAHMGNPLRFIFPKPLCQQAGCDFSFSGLKTAVRTAVLQLQAAGTVSDQDKADICASFQHTVAQVVENRLHHATTAARQRQPMLQTLVVAGGVAANQTLRRVMAASAAAHNLTFIAPPLALCTDNAAMIAWAGLERFRLGLTDPLTIKPLARWPLVSSA